jgi:hypothetical protein
MIVAQRQDRHNFREVVASRPRYGHNFREVVPIMAGRSWPAGDGQLRRPIRPLAGPWMSGPASGRVTVGPGARLPTVAEGQPACAFELPASLTFARSLACAAVSTWATVELWLNPGSVALLIA